MKFLKGLFIFILFLVVLAVIGRLFLFELAQTNSYSMVPNLVAGDLFLVKTVGAMGMGDVAVCENPEDPGNLVVLRIVGIPGQTIKIARNHLMIDGDMVEREMVEPLLYEDNTSGEQLSYAVKIGQEYIGGRLYEVALMDRAAGREQRETEVPAGHFYLLGDNRNMAHDSRNFGAVPIKSCIGRAVFLLWPGPDSGDLLKTGRMLSWID